MQQPNFSMIGRVALLTGAGRGIGLAIAQAFASAGASVAIQDIDTDVAQAEADKINATGGRAIALGGDITQLRVANDLVSQTLDQLGGLHVLVNNASIQMSEHWLNMNLESMDRQFQANLNFPIILTQHASRVFKKQRWGRVINIGSIQQRGGNHYMLAYSVSKAAMEKATVAMARDLAKEQITVNCISPGWFNTYRNREDFPDEAAVTELGKRIPIGRIGQPADCAGLALLLCSEAGSYITGQNIYVDGGMSTR